MLASNSRRGYLIAFASHFTCIYVPVKFKALDQASGSSPLPIFLCMSFPIKSSMRQGNRQFVVFAQPRPIDIRCMPLLGLVALCLSTAGWCSKHDAILELLPGSKASLPAADFAWLCTCLAR